MLSTEFYKNSFWIPKPSSEGGAIELSEKEVRDMFSNTSQENVMAKKLKEDVNKARNQNNSIITLKKFYNANKDFLDTQVGGSVVNMPYGKNCLTIDSKRFLYRGENKNYKSSLPTLNRLFDDNMDEKEKEIIRVIEYLRIFRFGQMLRKIKIVQLWEKKYGDINLDALAQHYGFPTHLLDLTNDLRTAIFFATCKYDSCSDSFSALTQQDIDIDENSKYGFIFQAQQWTIEFFNKGFFDKELNKIFYYNNSDRDFEDKKYYLQSSELDGVAFQIGYQPLLRCSYQSAYIYPMRHQEPLQKNGHFRIMKFKQSVKLSKWVYEKMDGGKKVFPNEGISKLNDYINEIKKTTTFSYDELENVYNDFGVDKKIFPNIACLKASLNDYQKSEDKYSIQDETINLDISQELLDLVNNYYEENNEFNNIGEIYYPNHNQK